MVATMLDGVGGFLGDEVLASAYGASPPDSAPREDHLSVLWARLWVAEHLFSTVEQPNRTSVAALRAELLAIANGDDPTLLARLPEAAKQGRSLARYKVLNAKLEILQWKAFIKDHCAVPIPVNAFNSWVKLGFDSSEANKWRGQVADGLGACNYDLAIGLANGFQFRLPVGYDANDVECAVRKSVAALVRAEQFDRA